MFYNAVGRLTAVARSFVKTVEQTTGKIPLFPKTILHYYYNIKLHAYGKCCPTASRSDVRTGQSMCNNCRGGGVNKLHFHTPTIVNSASIHSCIFTGLLKQKPSKRCQVDAKKLLTDINYKDLSLTLFNSNM